MAEYIEREAAVAVCCGQYKECLRKSDMCGDTVAWNICFEIKQLPAADVAPVRHARWKRDKKFNPYCTACGKDPLSAIRPEGNVDYCPNCGARMDLEVSE